MKDKLDRKIVTKFAGVRGNTYSYLIDDGNEDKKIKRHRKVCHKKKT